MDADGWLKGEVVDVLVTTNMARDAAGGLVPLTLPGNVGERHMSLEATVSTLALHSASPLAGCRLPSPNAYPRHSRRGRARSPFASRHAPRLRSTMLMPSLARCHAMPVACPSQVMTLAVLAKSFTAISPVTSVLADLPEALVLGAPPLLDAPDAAKRRHVLAQRTLRTLLLWLVALCAYPCALSPHGLALVEAVTGAMCSMLASLALPCAAWIAREARP